MMMTTSQPIVTLSPSEDPARLLEIVRRLRGVDRPLHERVLRELYPDVEAWTYRRLGASNDLEDTIQEALTEISTALYRFEGRASIRTLAYRITVRVVGRARARRRRHDWVPHSEELAEPRPDPEQRVCARGRAERLLELLEQLPEVQREAFVMCALDERTPQEAAELLGTREEAV